MRHPLVEFVKFLAAIVLLCLTWSLRRRSERTWSETWCRHSLLYSKGNGTFRRNRRNIVASSACAVLSCTDCQAGLSCVDQICLFQSCARRNDRTSGHRHNDRVHSEKRLAGTLQQYGKHTGNRYHSGTSRHCSHQTDHDGKWRNGCSDEWKRSDRLWHLR